MWHEADGDDEPARSPIRKPLPNRTRSKRSHIRSLRLAAPPAAAPPVPEHLTRAGGHVDEHAAYRAAERCGLNLSFPQLRGLGVFIRAELGGSLARVLEDYGRRALVRIEYYGQTCWVIWDQREEVVVTFLPPRSEQS